MKRLFTASEANQLWLTDLTEHWTSSGKLYCCTIKDACSNRIVGYSIKSTMHADIVVDVIEHAVARRGDAAGSILHADRGSQFCSQAIARALRRNDTVRLMGRVQSAADNAAMESFWSPLQRNVLNQQRRWASRQDPRLAIVVTWIERRYHRQREQGALGGLTPSNSRPPRNHPWPSWPKPKLAPIPSSDHTSTPYDGKTSLSGVED